MTTPNVPNACFYAAMLTNLDHKEFISRYPAVRDTVLLETMYGFSLRHVHNPLGVRIYEDSVQFLHKLPPDCIRVINYAAIPSLTITFDGIISTLETLNYRYVSNAYVPPVVERHIAYIMAAEVAPLDEFEKYTLNITYTALRSDGRWITG